MREGEDFPTVWQTLLKGHPLVDGIPRSRMDGNRSVLEIRLITGEWLVFDGDAKSQEIQRGLKLAEIKNTPSLGG